jgi:hypothetical protein
MFSAPHQCREPGCAQASARGSPYCEKHVTNNSRNKQDTWRKSNDPVRKLYAAVRWLNFRDVLIRQQQSCQRLWDGVRCQNKPTLVHHLRSPKERPDLFIVPSNCIALCAHCHPPDQGTPTWREGIEYVATVFRLMIFGSISGGG